MIVINNLSLQLGGKLLFTGVNLNLNPRNCYGLVGANGAGKSSFFRLLMQEHEASEGEVHISKKASIGWLKQDQFKYENDAIIEVVIQGRQELYKVYREKEKLMQKEELSDEEGMKLADLEEKIGLLGGYEAESLAEMLLEGLGVAPEYHHKPLKTLSGGYKLRVLLARSLFINPDILLLDEPTNYLDILSIAWLEQYLRLRYEGLLLIISHDQHFLNSLSNYILDFDYGDIRLYTGNYDKFVEQKAAVEEQKVKEKKHVEDKIAKMRMFVEKFRYKPSKARQAMSREKQMEKIEVPDLDRSSRCYPRFNFKQKRPSGHRVIEVKKLSKSFGESKVLNQVGFEIERHEKVAVLGANGVGKSTLLKILLSSINADEGTFKWGHAIFSEAFFEDDLSENDLKKSLEDWAYDKSNEESSMTVRRVLGNMLFTDEDWCKKISQLSGGELTRLKFAVLMLRLPNVLILDEPTNHLDLEARVALAKALRSYEGTVIFVSHDREFVAQLASRVLFLDKESHEAIEFTVDEAFAQIEQS
ncbi:MAG: ATP-binding cassette domain-containing protein [Chlamydiales bacterium]|nr:ATP-binding cassette domain-containing protein [Chlamydiales bacterium]NCF71732.1 ATP-binding cassette domain-containing protein [Chlamydiales bacterium]